MEDLDPDIVSAALRAQMMRAGVIAFSEDLTVRLAAFREANGRASTDLEMIQIVAGAFERFKLGLRLSSGTAASDAEETAKAVYLSAAHIVRSCLGSERKASTRTVVDVLDLFRRHAEDRIFMELAHARGELPKPLDAATWSAERSLAATPALVRAVTERT